MTSAEFAEYLAYYSIEPFGEERADWRSAIVAAAVFNGMRGKGQAAHPARDFLAVPIEEPQQTGRQQRRIMEEVFAAVRGSV